MNRTQNNPKNPQHHTLHASVASNSRLQQQIIPAATGRTSTGRTAKPAERGAHSRRLRRRSRAGTPDTGLRLRLAQLAHTLLRTLRRLGRTGRPERGLPQIVEATPALLGRGGGGRWCGNGGRT